MNASQSSDPKGPVIRFRAFRNGDPPALASLWNRSLPDRGVVRPLSPHEFDSMVIGRIDFDRQGLIVAEEEGKVVGFVHAGFGPDDPPGPDHRLDRALGTIAMLVVEPAREPGDLADQLIESAQTYLQGRGAKVIYLGGQAPLNPYYWGIYGGSEWAGILESHGSFLKAAQAAGYLAVSKTTMLDIDLSAAEVRDPKAPLIRRQARLEVVEDATPADWWEALALGNSQILRFRLIAKGDETELAHASAWDMSAFGRIDGRARTGIFGLEVAANHRRQGFGRHLISEILRHVKADWGEVVSVQTRSTNEPALKLYRSIGFEVVDSAILFRRPGSRT